MSEINDLNTFKMNFYEKYHKVLVPAISGMESERKSSLFWAIFWSVLLILLGIGYFYLMIKFKIDGKHSADPGVYLIGFGFGMYYLFKKNFESKIKNRIMDTVCSCFGNFSWTSSYSQIAAQRFVDVGLFPSFTGFDPDDVFLGTYKDVSIDIVEAEYERGSGKNRTTVFKGLCIKLDMNKNFKGHTLLMEDKLMHKSPLPGLRHTELEDVNFEKKYDVFTDDEVEARYILTPTLMEKLTNIKMAFKCKSIRCAFKEEKLYIAMKTSKDLFSLGSLRKPVTDTKQFATLCQQFISVLSLIDYLKLDKKAVL